MNIHGILSSKHVKKNYPRDNPRLDSRHALVCKINIHTHNPFAQIFSGFFIAIRQFFSNASTLYLTEIYLRWKYKRYYFLLAACRESELITKKRIVPKNLYNSYNRIEPKENVVIY